MFCYARQGFALTGAQRAFRSVRLRFAPETRLRRLPTGQFVSFGNLRMQVVLFGLDPSPQAQKGLGDCFYVGLSFHIVLLCEARFRPHGRPKGFPIGPPPLRSGNSPSATAHWQFVSFGNLRAPSVHTIRNMIVGGTVSLCYLLKKVVGVQTEGVQGAIGKPPGCTGKDKPDI